MELTALFTPELVGKPRFYREGHDLTPREMRMAKNPAITIVAWNARGICRPSFIENLNHILTYNNPTIVVIIETRTFIHNAMKVIREPPFKSFDYAEPDGLSGGIMVLWDDCVVD